MTRKILTACATAVLAFPLVALAASSEVTGTITTGISTGLSGIVDAMPVADPGAGTYSSAQHVTLDASGADSIHYTTDETEPTCTSGSVYTGAIDVSSSETIKAVGCYSGAASRVALFAYGINLPAAPSGGGGGGGEPVVTTAAITGDINDDGAVDILDFNTLIAQWGQTGSSLSADLNHDGVVDILDFNVLMSNWTA